MCANPVLMFLIWFHTLNFCLVHGEFPAQRPETQSFDVFFWPAPEKNGWVNKGEAGDLRSHGAH